MYPVSRHILSSLSSLSLQSLKALSLSLISTCLAHSFVTYFALLHFLHTHTHFLHCTHACSWWRRSKQCVCVYIMWVSGVCGDSVGIWREAGGGEGRGSGSGVEYLMAGVKKVTAGQSLYLPSCPTLPCPPLLPAPTPPLHTITLPHHLFTPPLPSFPTTLPWVGALSLPASLPPSFSPASLSSLPLPYFPLPVNMDGRLTLCAPSLLRALARDKHTRARAYRHFPWPSRQHSAHRATAAALTRCLARALPSAAILRFTVLTHWRFHITHITACCLAAAAFLSRLLLLLLPTTT